MRSLQQCQPDSGDWDAFVRIRILRSGDPDACMRQAEALDESALIMLIRGECMLTVGSRILYLYPGDGVLLPPLTLFCPRSCAGHEYNLLIMECSLPVLYSSNEFILPDSMLSHKPVLFSSSLQEGNTVQNYIYQIMAEGSTHDDYHITAQKTILFQMLIRIMRSKCPALDLPDPDFSPVLQTIYEKYAGSLNPSDVSRLTGISNYRLSLLFKRYTGCTFTEYLQKVRILHAQFLLRSGHCSIASAATQSGFTDSAYFSRLFRNLTGASPSAYRSRYRLLRSG